MLGTFSTMNAFFHLYTMRICMVLIILLKLIGLVLTNKFVAFLTPMGIYKTQGKAAPALPP